MSELGPADDVLGTDTGSSCVDILCPNPGCTNTLGAAPGLQVFQLAHRRQGSSGEDKLKHFLLTSPSLPSPWPTQSLQCGPH